jgi:predicted CoA-binding protein
MGKDTVVIGATSSPEKYGYKATASLNAHGHKVYPVDLRAGKILDIDILTGKPVIQNVDTVSLYVGPKFQADWQDYIFSLKPKRIIFNPGTENPVFEKAAQEKGIETIEACTLVMLSIGNY